MMEDRIIGLQAPVLTHRYVLSQSSAWTQGSAEADRRQSRPSSASQLACSGDGRPSPGRRSVSGVRPVLTEEIL